MQQILMQHKLREDIRRLTANIERNFSNPDKQVHVAVWRAVRDIRRIQLRKFIYKGLIC